MASEETMNILQLHSSTLKLGDEDEIEDCNDEDDHHRHSSHSHYLSRLSLCATSGKPPTFTPNLYDDDDNDDDDGFGVGVDITDMGLDMARLSIEGEGEGEGEGSSEEDADVELSDGKEGRNKGVPIPIGMSDSEDKETCCYSLPATPPRVRRRRARPCGYGSGNLLAMGLKEKTTSSTYCCSSPSSSSSSWTRRRLAGSAMRDRDRDRDKAWDEKNNHPHKYGNIKAEEEEEDGGSECVVITRPKGGARSLCMDLEEVKACRDLGFELDHERMMMVDNPTPGRISISVPAASTIDFDTSSGGNSPIANWRISSPGDDPRDVKARLKVWAQAVALASTSGHGP
ncbi:uncharacterized protein LOC122672579 [Telopea speciosissima]|uniref:uncharacterized protein LOC122672579 n=1 Tax=Telopea speciosissima TaxID=54955 RepID=UPI001CC4FDD4|nr:uncharacterized protein LOC122672579 [Telopea speciosissima]